MYFQYFGDGNGLDDPDLEAIVSGIIKAGEVPGSACSNDTELAEFVKNGDIASCSNKSGARDDPMAVLDSRFRVRKAPGLDASLFPRAGYFIVSVVYLISEKAADVIIEDARA